MTQWQFDQAHTSADFSVKHMMVSTVRGSIKGVSGAINFDPANRALSSVEASLDASTITTGMVDRDNHLRSADFLDVEAYPTIDFKSTKVDLKGDNEAAVTGDLTLHGVTRSVVLNVEFLGEQKNPFTGGTVAGFTATTKINREDFGLTWNQALEAGGVLVGKEIKIELDVEAIPVTEAENA